MIVHLVRHGRPWIRSDQPPSGWDLSPTAPPEIARLRDSGILPENGFWVSSSEPKALATARTLTDRPVLATDALREMRRPAGLLAEHEFRAAVRSSLLRPDRPARPDWETGEETGVRVRTALETYQAMAGDRELVLVGHGTAWTLLVAALTETEPDVGAWERLRMPDHCAISLTRTPARIVHPWGSWPP